MCTTQWILSMLTEKVLDQMEYKVSLTTYHLIPASVHDVI